MIRRIMQVEITPDPEMEGRCEVVIREPHTGSVLLFLREELTDVWTHGMKA
jgi:hypothetical protein